MRDALFPNRLPIDMVKRIILPNERQQSQSRGKFIEKFLKAWLTEKQIASMGSWHVEMLDAFMTEVLLHAQKVGLEKLLIHQTASMVNFPTRYPLAIIPKKQKAKVAQVILEEVDGNLAENTKSVLLSDVKIDDNNI